MKIQRTKNLEIVKENSNESPPLSDKDMTSPVVTFGKPLNLLEIIN